MLNICFSDSEKGCLKAADFKNVISLYGLDMFDIKEITGQIRMQQFSKLFFNDKQENELFWKYFINDFQTLKKFIQKGEKLRIWYSNTPYSMCGFYFIASLLKETSSTITTIKLPKETGYLSWAQVYPSEFKNFLSEEKELYAEEYNFISQKWNVLKKENSMLRVIKNEALTSVNIDYYDCYIYKELNNKPITEGYLIGNVLGKHQLGISDGWIATRIDSMILRGELKIIEDNKITYKRILQKRLI